MARAWGASFADAWGVSFGSDSSAVTPAPTPDPTPEPTAPPVQIVQSGGGNSMGIRFLPITLPHQFKPEMTAPKRPIEEDEALLLAVL